MSLRELRQKRGLSQQRLASKVEGMSQGRVGDYESCRIPIENMT